MQCTDGEKGKLSTKFPVTVYVSHQDAFLWQDAVAPPSELLEEEQDAEDKTGWLNMSTMKLAEVV